MRLLGLKPGELGPVARLAAVYALVGAASAAGDAMVHAVFLARAGADALPVVLLAKAIISPALAFLYAHWAKPRPTKPVLAVLAIVVALVEASLPWIGSQGRYGAVAVHVVHDLFTALLTIHWGVYLLDHLDRPAARRGVAPIYAAWAGGGAVAGLALAPLVPLIGTRGGLMVAAVLFLLVAPLAWLPIQKRPSVIPLAIDPTESEEANATAPKRAGHLLRSPLLIALAIATVFLALTRDLLQYQHKAILESIPEAELATLLSLYAGGAGLIGMIIQLIVTGRLLERIGEGRTNLFYSASTVIAQALMLALGATSIGAALAARFAGRELKHALKTPVSPLFYQGFWGPDRIRAHAFVLGLVSPLSRVIAALILAGLVTSTSWIPWVGLVAAISYFAASIAQGRTYDRAMHRGTERSSDSP